MHTIDAPVGRRLTGQSEALVVADDVRIRFGAIEAAGPISFSVMRGEFVSLLGPSGCGKSSLLRAIAGLVPVADGTLTIAGQMAGTAASMKVGLMFQKPLLLPWRTTLQNVVLPAEIAMRSAGTIGRFERGQALNLLDIVGLT